MILIALTIAVATAIGVVAEHRSPRGAGNLARGLLRAMLYWLVPPVVFFNIAHLEFTTEVGAGIGLAWVAVVLVGLIAAFVGERVLRLSRPETGTLINASLHPNTGYLGLPLCAAVLGTDSLDVAIAYDVLVGTPTLLLGVFAVGAAYGTEAGETPRQRIAAFFTRNPPLFAAILGLLAPNALAPDALVDASRVLVFALLPIGFFSVGVMLCEEPLTRAPDRRIATALVLRLVVAPLLLLGLAAPLIDLPDAYLIAAAMPTGLNGLTVAHAYGLDLRMAAGAVAWGTGIVVAAGTVIALVAG